MKRVFFSAIGSAACCLAMVSAHAQTTQTTLPPNTTAADFIPQFTVQASSFAFGNLISITGDYTVALYDATAGEPVTLPTGMTLNTTVSLTVGDVYDLVITPVNGDIITLLAGYQLWWTNVLQVLWRNLADWHMRSVPIRICSL